MTILVAEMSSTDNLLQFLGVSILFIFILAITYFTTKFVGGYKMEMNKNSNFKVHETYKVTQNKYLQIIQVGKRYFVIAVGKEEIQLISEIDEDELTLKDSLKVQKVNFTDMFNTVMNKQKDKNKQIDQMIYNDQTDQENQKNDL
jgi:flagellar protein FliO/FliZ